MRWGCGGGLVKLTGIVLMVLKGFLCFPTVAGWREPGFTEEWIYVWKSWTLQRRVITLSWNLANRAKKKPSLIWRVMARFTDRLSGDIEVGYAIFSLDMACMESKSGITMMMTFKRCMIFIQGRSQYSCGVSKRLAVTLPVENNQAVHHHKQVMHRKSPQSSTNYESHQRNMAYPYLRIPSLQSQPSFTNPYKLVSPVLKDFGHEVCSKLWASWTAT